MSDYWRNITYLKKYLDHELAEKAGFAKLEYRKGNVRGNIKITDDKSRTAAWKAYIGHEEDGTLLLRSLGTLQKSGSDFILNVNEESGNIKDKTVVLLGRSGEYCSEGSLADYYIQTDEPEDEAKIVGEIMIEKRPEAERIPEVQEDAEQETAVIGSEFEVPPEPQKKRRIDTKQVIWEETTGQEAAAMELVMASESRTKNMSRSNDQKQQYYNAKGEKNYESGRNVTSIKSENQISGQPTELVRNEEQKSNRVAEPTKKEEQKFSQQTEPIQKQEQKFSQQTEPTKKEEQKSSQQTEPTKKEEQKSSQQTEPMKQKEQKSGQQAEPMKREEQHLKQQVETKSGQGAVPRSNEEGRQHEPAMSRDIKSKESPIQKENLEPSSKEAPTGDWISQIMKVSVGMYPFHDDELNQCVRIEPKDFGLLPSKHWALGSNSFLLNGYYSYRHVLLGVKEENGKRNCYLGVPGMYHRREIFMAKMFGFSLFKGVQDKKTVAIGDFGYWMMLL